MKQPKRVSVSSNEFGAVLEIINAHRAKALVSVNVEHLLTNWEIGGNRIVQSATGHLPYGEFVQPRAAQIQAADLPDVQPAAAQIAPMPYLLALTTFTNIVEILNRTQTAQERLFYIVYSFRERLKKLELRRCLVNDTYSSLLGGDKKNFSKALVAAYPDSPVVFKDSAFVDFLNLPEKHSDGLCEPR